jgi:hypothetical protein
VFNKIPIRHNTSTRQIFIKPKISLKQYFSDPVKCIFNKDIKPWQKFVCGSIGVTAGIGGMTAIIGGMTVGCSMACHTLYNTLYKANESHQLDRQIEKNDSSFDNDSLYKANESRQLDRQIEKKDSSKTHNGFETIMKFIPPSVIHGCLLSLSLLMIPITSIYAVQFARHTYRYSQKYFQSNLQNLKKMDNCCNIIKHTTRVSLDFLSAASALAFSFAFVGGSCLMSHVMYTTISKHWLLNNYIDKLDEVHDKGYKLSPILD